MERRRVAATPAHVYTECARIWNPIHTDIAVARGGRAARLILHGTATLALAVSRVRRARPRRRPRARERGHRPLHRHGAHALARHGARRGARRRDRRSSFEAVDERGRARAERGSRRRMKQMTRRERVLAALRPPAHRPPALRVLAPLSRRRPLAGRAGAGHAPLPRALRLGLPEDHAARRLRRRGLGLRRGRRGPPDGHRPVRAAARSARPKTGRRSARSIRGPRRVRRAARDDHPLGFDRRDRRRAGRARPLFSPLSLARKLSGDRLKHDLREHPDAVTDALEAITETLIAFAELALAGERVGHLLLDPGGQPTASTPRRTTRRFGEPYDRRFLDVDPVDAPTLTIIHCHGERLMFDRLAALPGPRLELGRPRARRRRSARAQATRRRARSSEGSTSGRRCGTAPPRRPSRSSGTRSPRPAAPASSWAPGCVLPMNTPDATVAAVVRALGGPLKPIPGIAP